MVGIFHFLITCQTDNKNLASKDFGKLESAVFFLPENNSRWKQIIGKENKCKTFDAEKCQMSTEALTNITHKTC